LPRLEDILALPRQRVDAIDRRLHRALLANSRAHGLRLARVSARLNPATLSQRLGRGRERLDTLVARTSVALLNRISSRRRHLESAGQMLKSLSYQSVLQRGYALVRDGSGKTVRLAASLAPAMALSIEFADGTVDAETKGGPLTAASPSVAPASSPPVSRPAAKAPRSDKDGGGQGSLF
jgi:exodeoxyribonuclease VII large subunit